MFEKTFIFFNFVVLIFKINTTYNDVLKTVDADNNYVNEFNWVEALSKSFTEVYNFASVRNLEMALDERFWLFKSEMREQLLKRNKTDKRAYLKELCSEFEKLENDFKESLANSISDPTELQKMQLFFLKISNTYLIEQCDRYVSKDVELHKHKDLDVDGSVTNFGFLETKYHVQLLRDFYTAVQDELHCFDSVLTSPDVFVFILTHTNLSELSSDFGIHFACDSVCAAHCLRAIKPWFSNLSFVNIERSRRFYTATETIFTANYISNLLTKDFKLRTTLEKIVADL